MLYEAATKGKRTLVTFCEDWCENPREVSDGLGAMYCWHRRYNLGDPHDYSTPEDLLNSLLCEYASPRQVYHHVRRAGNVRLSYDRHDRAWVLESYDPHAKAWYEDARYPPGLTPATLPEGFVEDVAPSLGVSAKLAILRSIKGMIIMPLFLYDHSGITMSTSPYACPWDSGQVGWIIATPDKIAEEYGDLTPKAIRRATKYMEIEVREFDHYLTGECYGYAMYEEGVEVERFGGTYGEYHDIRKWIKRDLPRGWKHLVDKLEPRCGEDIDAYLCSHVAA